MAETFGCVPSQVTYVINTRFTEEEGYLAESRRGGKGYVRITKFIKEDDPIVEASRNSLMAHIDKLYKQKSLTKNETELLKHLVVYAFKDLEPRDQSNLFTTLKRF